MATTIRASDRAHAQLKRWAEEEGSSLTEVLDKVVEQVRRRRFHRRANEAYRRLRDEHPEAWKDHRAERDLWAQTDSDGLDSFPYDHDRSEKR